MEEGQSSLVAWQGWRSQCPPIPTALQAESLLPSLTQHWPHFYSTNLLGYCLHFSSPPSSTTWVLNLCQSVFLGLIFCFSNTTNCIAKLACYLLCTINRLITQQCSLLGSVLSVQKPSRMLPWKKHLLIPRPSAPQRNRNKRQRT